MQNERVEQGDERKPHVVTSSNLQSHNDSFIILGYIN